MNRKRLTAFNVSPTAIGHSEPMRPANRPASGAKMMIITVYRQGAQPGLKGRVALDVLEEEAQEEEHAEHPEADGGRAAGSGRERAVAEEAELEHGTRAAAFDQDEGDQPTTATANKVRMSGEVHP